MKINCIICGKFFIVQESLPDRYDDDEDMPVKKSIVFCQLCEARIKNESDQSQKVPKPM